MRTNTGQILYIPRIGQRANLQHPLMKGCVGWWPLSDGGGTNAVDLSGNGNDGTQSGGVSWASTTKGTAASFDGVDDRFDLTTLGGYQAFSNPITISMWCYLRDDSIQQYWFNKHNSTNSDFRLFAWTRVAGELEFKLYDGTAEARKRYGGLATQILNKWTHLVFVSAGPDYSLGSNLELYVNGAVETPTQTSDATYSGNQDASGILTLGGRYPDDTRNIDASFQNVRVYNRALSATEVLELYTNPWSGLSIPSETRYFFVPQLITASPKLFNIKGSSISMTSNTGRVSVRAAR